MKHLISILKNLIESSIDFPSEDLPLDIWQKEGDSYILKPELKEKILDALSQYPDLDLLDIADNIHIVGSIGTNLYDEDADIDIHIVPNPEKLPTKDPDELQELQRNVMNWFKNNRDEKDWYVNEHPFEVYLQLNPTQDYYSDTIYDLLEDKWLKPHRKYDLTYNPYEIYGNVFTEIQKLTAPADIAIGELRRDVIDYNRLTDAMKKLSKSQKEKLKGMLETKLDELEDDIENLAKNKEVWRDVRHKNNISTTELEDDISKLTQSDEWKQGNAIFKLIDRYAYMTLINNLNKLIDGQDLSDDDIPKIEELLKKFNNTGSNK